MKWWWQREESHSFKLTIEGDLLLAINRVCAINMIDIVQFFKKAVKLMLICGEANVDYIEIAYKDGSYDVVTVFDKKK